MTFEQGSAGTGEHCLAACLVLDASFWHFARCLPVERFQRRRCYSRNREEQSMDTIQITLAITAATFAAAVTFAKANASPAGSFPISTAILAGDQLSEGQSPFAKQATMVTQGVPEEVRD
eukprot:GHVR01168455.1.p1 GENE.GHVR01168455.1~~GHVR01168455.1.p1  ORF type:complete len:120 (+),score=3.71 GHVR01168455.1:187-546(+)